MKLYIYLSEVKNAGLLLVLEYYHSVAFALLVPPLLAPDA